MTTLPLRWSCTRCPASFWNEWALTIHGSLAHGDSESEPKEGTEMSNVRVIHPVYEPSLADDIAKAEQAALDALVEAEHAALLAEIPWRF